MSILNFLYSFLNSSLFANMGSLKVCSRLCFWRSSHFSRLSKILPFFTYTHANQSTILWRGIVHFFNALLSGVTVICELEWMPESLAFSLQNENSHAFSLFFSFSVRDLDHCNLLSCCRWLWLRQGAWRCCCCGLLFHWACGSAGGLAFATVIGVFVCWSAWGRQFCADVPAWLGSLPHDA